MIMQGNGCRRSLKENETKWEKSNVLSLKVIPLKFNALGLEKISWGCYRKRSVTITVSGSSNILCLLSLYMGFSCFCSCFCLLCGFCFASCRHSAFSSSHWWSTRISFSLGFRSLISLSSSALWWAWSTHSLRLPLINFASLVIPVLTFNGFVYFLF